MMLLSLCCLLVTGLQDREVRERTDYLTHGAQKVQFAYVRTKLDPLEPPKLSPKRYPPGNKPWEFTWLTTGFVRTTPDQYDLRFRVYSQDRKETKDQAQLVTTMSLRLWELLTTRLGADHAETQRGVRFIDIYLAWGGEAGGEQAFTEDFESGRPRRANTITFYDMASFTDPLEMAREVAHEYGHAVLPPIGGFSTPEDWGNGFLGEKLFMRWLRDEMAEGHLTPDDVMGTRLVDLDRWVSKNVTPLEQTAASRPPNMKILGGKGQKALDEFLGLALYADSILPDKVFSRSLRLVGSMKASDYPEALILAVAEGDFNLEIPATLQGKPLWIPLGKAQLKNAKVLSKSGNWVQIKPLGSPVHIIAPKEVTGQG